MSFFPPKKVLLAFDFSDPTHAALGFALSLRDRFGASIEALHSVVPIPVGEWPIGLEEFDQEAKRRVREQAKSALGPGVAVHVKHGSPVDLILKRGRGLNPDLIVLGTHGRTGLDLLISGSVAESVVRKSSVPVFVAKSSGREIRSVLAPVNFTRYSDAAFLRAVEFAAAYGASLTAFHAAGDEAERRIAGPRMTDLIDWIPARLLKCCKIEKRIVVGKPVEQIVKAASRADAVVLSAHRKSFLGDLVLGTSFERVLRHSPVPVLAIPSIVAERKKEKRWDFVEIPVGGLLP